MSFIKILFCVTLFTSLMGTLSLSLLWRKQVSTQWRLDQCVKEKALILKKIQIQIEKSNHRIQAERKAVVAALIAAPESVPTLQKIIQGEVLFQTIQLRKWNQEQASWILRRGCHQKKDFFYPLPSLLWRRPPPDPIGEQALRWPPSAPQQLSIRLWNPPIQTHAMIRKQLGNIKKQEWSAYYAPF